LRTLTHNNKVLAYTGHKDTQTEKGWVFSDNSLPFIFGFGNFDKGYVGQAHLHNIRSRISPARTIEFMFVAEGSIRVNIYLLDKTLHESFVLRKGGWVCFVECGHEIIVRVNKTQLIETKMGAYISDAIEKERF
jgi:hypothetical protein